MTGLSERQEEGFLTPRFTFKKLKQHMMFGNITYVREVKQCVGVIAMTEHRQHAKEVESKATYQEN